jgi:lysozyme family protein
MAKIEKFTPFLLKWEGEFANDPVDAGGATMKGITFSTFKACRKEKGLPTPAVEDLKHIPDSEWTAIFRDKYWNPWQADRIKSQAVANLLVDWGFNSGVKTAVLQFQALAGQAKDGIVGEKTLSAINSAGETVLFNRIWTARKDFYVNIVKNSPPQVKFLSGWLNRLYDNTLYNFSFSVKG